ncbi:MAG TPA: DUF3429 domain-containing protein [Vitreimonas sp.]|uniref:DUF3429 domain-containing protein n=1 Tax=Vitreimonas sp. TaxID=3069702 RepID=UPI002D686457|nr:DUF3429 domain-containing protein [Vitreimonas sp.]HYD86639.1 DUF3429 domain-containing protein [Vitreimonas sp.]
MNEPPPLLPRAALRLGFLGLAPLAVGALVSLSQHHETALLGAIGFSLYAAVLLSFLGGVRCGFELMRAPQAPEGLRLLFSALPALAGWALALLVVLVPAAIAAASAFAGLFAAQYAWDHRSAADAGAPLWYPLLRQVLTGGAMIICLLIPLATALHRI